MKNNFERYRGQDSYFCEKKTFVSLLVGRRADEIITQKLSSLDHLAVLELGCGSGRFTRCYYKRNHVTCLDINPHLFRPLPGVEIIEGNVVDLDILIPRGARYDLIFSAWLTEYLDRASLFSVLQSCQRLLAAHGKMIFTFINRDCLGSIYIGGARLKGIRKYNYSLPEIASLASQARLRIVEVSSVRRLGFARLITLAQSGQSRA